MVYQMEVTMKIVLSILGVLLVLIGIVWILQGLNILLGSVMSGQIQWAIIGVLAAIIGAALIYYANRRANLPR